MAIGPEQITNIAIAAAEIQSQYDFFNEVAIQCDLQYIKSLMAGQEGRTWRMLSVSPERKIPILPEVIRQDGRIKLGPECDPATGIRCKYYLGSSEIDEIIRLHVTGQIQFGGQDARDYLVLPKGIMLEAVGRGNYSMITAVDEYLQKTIVDLQVYAVFA